MSDSHGLPERWTHEVDHHQDHGGADDYHHVVAGDQHIAEVASAEVANLIVNAVNAYQRTDQGLVTMPVTTRHPENYVLFNRADGTAWEHGPKGWVRSEWRPAPAMTPELREAFEAILAQHYPHGYACGEKCGHNLNSPEGRASHLTALLEPLLTQASSTV